MRDADRRASRRYRTVLPVRLRCGASWRQGESRDVSAGGIFVELGDPPPVGEVVEVMINVLGMTEIGARGPVMYQVPGVGVGIHFLEMSYTAQKQLRDLVAVLEAREDSPLPPRPPR
jgi:hypothetical protein